MANKKEPQKNVEQAAEIKPGYNLKKPYLLTRMFSSFLDFILVILIFAGIEAALYYTAFDMFGYSRMMNEAHTVLTDSHLYTFQEGKGYIPLTETYNKEMSPDDNYDIPITYYYTNDSRAISDNLFSKYNTAKLTSGYFQLNEENNQIIRTETDDAKVRVFYELEFSKAASFLEKDPVYYRAVQGTYYIVIFTCLFSVTLASSIIYLFIPLLRKDGETPFQIVFKICLVDGRNDTKVKRKQIVIRFVVLVLFNIWIPFLLYVEFTYFTLIPNLITLIMISVTKSFSGPHDYVSHTYVATKRDIEIPEIRPDSGLTVEDK